MEFVFPTNRARQGQPAPRNLFVMQGVGFQPAGDGFETFSGWPFFSHQQAGGDEQDFHALFANLFSHTATGPDASFFEAAFQPREEQEPRQPATAEACLRALPTVKVTENDMEAENDECTICFDKLSVGDSALRIPCGHLFHEDCVRKWLESSNQCPVCRYELPTDDAAFESGRRARMVNRRPRLRVKDLSAKGVRELRHLADHLGVCTDGCLEKSDLVDAIVESGRVELIHVVSETPPIGLTPSLEHANSARSVEALALLAIEDGEPIIQSFLGGSASLGSLSRQCAGTVPNPNKPEPDQKSTPALVRHEHSSSKPSADA
jgi:hypothetical protein